MAEHPSNDRPIRRALLSVHDKAGLTELAAGLARHGVELVSTGGTAARLRDAGLKVIDVATVTGSAEILDGRVKTLHPAIHGGILARRDLPRHTATLGEHGIATIDLVVVNLYPFAATLARGASAAECIEEIDIGGPALIRAAAKNHADVTVMVDPADYPRLLEAMAAGGTELDWRRHLARKAFARTAAYDAAIAAWLGHETGVNLPERLTVGATLRQALRYGENPHQQAAFYVGDGPALGLAAARQVQGKPLSYNNLADADAALALAAELAEPAVVIVKHSNPCGVATGPGLAAAHQLALATDPLSAFGGIVACNRPLDEAAAAAITSIFTEVVLAPAADEAARTVFAQKPNLRLLLLDAMPDPQAAMLELRSIAGGLLVQDRDAGAPTPLELRLVTGRAPTEAELADLRFAWTVVKHVKSNAIVLAREGATLGIGMGQTSRVDAVELAARRAAAHADNAAGRRACVVASDAFFPFPDGLEAAAAAGATAAIQPGGSVKDEAVIAAADKAGIAMLFTGVRHFRH